MIKKFSCLLVILITLSFFFSPIHNIQAKSFSVVLTDVENKEDKSTKGTEFDIDGVKKPSSNNGEGVTSPDDKDLSPLEKQQIEDSKEETSFSNKIIDFFRVIIALFGFILIFASFAILTTWLVDKATGFKTLNIISFKRLEYSQDEEIIGNSRFFSNEGTRYLDFKRLIALLTTIIMLSILILSGGLFFIVGKMGQLLGGS